MDGLLRLVSTVAAGLVVLGFVLFAIDAINEGSAETVARITDPGAEIDRSSDDRGDVRKAIDDANDFLLAPFDGLVDEWHSEWARHGVSALLGFLVYGFALRMLANTIPRRRPKPVGWETPR